MASSIPTLPHVLGVHTLVPGLFALNNDLLKNTILEYSNNKLPPYLIVVGDRRRVDSISLLFEKYISLPNFVSKHNLSTGRVNLSIGIYHNTPILICEHQMGCSAAEIIIREIIDYMSNLYNYNNIIYNSDKLYIIRVGSSAGINKWENADIDAFDIAIVSHQIGMSGADLQSLTGCLNYFEPKMANDAKPILQSLGYKFVDNWPHLDLDKELVAKLTETAKSLNDTAVKVHVLGNVSKDSLYAESSEDAFVQLREKYDVGTSEMEFSTISRMAQQSSIHGKKIVAGCVLSVLGLIPGGSFAEDKGLEAISSKLSVQIALETLASISKSHIKN